MATRRNTKSGRIGAKGKRNSRRREVQKVASAAVALIGAASPWVIYWMSGGK